MKYLLLIVLLIPTLGWGQALDTIWFISTTDIEDTWVNSDDPAVNYGSDTNLIIGDAGGEERSIVVHIPYLADSVNDFGAGWAIKEARLDMNVFFWPDIGNPNAEAYFIVKPCHLEDEITYNRWSSHFANFFEWGTAGINNTGVVWNESDGADDDRSATSQGEVTISGTGWHYFDVDTAWINNVITLDSTLKYVIQDVGTGYADIYSSEAATSANTLRFRVIMEEEAVAGLATMKHSPDENRIASRHGGNPSARHGP